MASSNWMAVEVVVPVTMKMVRRGVVEVVVGWVHLMLAPVEDCLAVRKVLRQVGMTDDERADHTAAEWGGLVAMD